MKRFNPPFYFAITLLLAFALHFVFPIVTLLNGPGRLLGLLPILAGGWVTIWADSIFKQMKTTVKPDNTPSTMVTSGPFSLSRHPMYLGMLAILLGIALILGSLAGFAGAVLFWGILQFVFIPHEERVMRSEFGDSYIEYCGQARMWI